MKPKSPHAKIFMPQAFAQSQKPLQSSQNSSIRGREEVYWDRNNSANKNKQSQIFPIYQTNGHLERSEELDTHKSRVNKFCLNLIPVIIQQDEEETIPISKTLSNVKISNKMRLRTKHNSFQSQRQQYSQRQNPSLSSIKRQRLLGPLLRNKKSLYDIVVLNPSAGKKPKKGQINSKTNIFHQVEISTEPLKYSFFKNKKNQDSYIFGKKSSERNKQKVRTIDSFESQPQPQYYSNIPKKKIHRRMFTMPKV